MLAERPLTRCKVSTELVVIVDICFSGSVLARTKLRLGDSWGQWRGVRDRCIRGNVFSKELLIIVPTSALVILVYNAVCLRQQPRLYSYCDSLGG